MLYVTNCHTKEELKQQIGKPLEYFDTSWYGNEFEPDGLNVVVGPHYSWAVPMDEMWSALVMCEDGIITYVV